MRKVLKWDVPVDDVDHPVGSGPVVLVACQHGPEVVRTEETNRPSTPCATRRSTAPATTWLGSQDLALMLIGAVELAGRSL